jgi:hypothetical protein
MRLVGSVDSVGQLWNRLLEDIKSCAQFIRELKEAEKDALQDELSEAA